MRRSLLAALLRARQGATPLALITDLGTGLQTLLTDGGPAQGDLGLTDDLRETAAAALRADRSQTVQVGEGRYAIQVFNPPLRMVIVGAVHIAQSLAPMAALAGYQVTVVDPRRAFASQERFPGVTLDYDWPDEALARLTPDRRTAVVTLTHDPKLDDPALLAALGSPAFYIGALGSRGTHGKRLDRLKAAGVEEGALARIHGPVGLDLGASSPAEIAVSILAQATQVLRGGPKAARPSA